METTKDKGRRLNLYVPDYVVFDLETTGISTKKDSIIEISAVKVKQGIIEEEFSTLVKPERHIPEGATAVNGITDDMVADAPLLEEVLEDFLEFTDGQVLVGHNIHAFDMKFIYLAAEELFQRAVYNDYVDTLYMARKCLPFLKHHTLKDVSFYFGISTVGAHRALNDCVMNQKCFEELGKMMAADSELQKPEQVCPLCGAELVLRKGRYGRFYGCSGYPACRFTRNE